MSALLLHLLRHGAPETPGLLMGRTDGAPTSSGMEACAEQVHQLQIDAIVSSDMQRTARTAQMIASQRGLSVTVDPRWRELDFGAWDGLAIGMIDPGACQQFWDDPDAFPPPDGERWTSLVERVAAAIAEIKGRSTLIVTHGGAIRAALAHLCGFDHARLWAFDLPYNSLLTLKVWPGAEPTAQIVSLRP